MRAWEFNLNIDINPFAEAWVCSTYPEGESTVLGSTPDLTLSQLLKDNPNWLGSHAAICIVDDTIASHTKPSSQAAHPIEVAYFHQSHLKGRQDYGH